MDTLRRSVPAVGLAHGLLVLTSVTDDGLERIALSISWQGGDRVDLVKLVHNEQVVPYQVRIVDSNGRTTTIEYAASREGHARRIRALFAFVGEIRSNLEARCAVDGRLLGDVICEPHAAHRWEIDHVWTESS